MKEQTLELDIDQIEFDIDNPRIKMALEKYGDKLNAERIHFALSSATEGSSSTSSFAGLRDSIRANRGIVAPIIVIKKNGEFVCIDGNTRLAIYIQFRKDGVAGNWSKIKATVLEEAKQREVETVRITQHLVGSREWPAYEKARYLHHLRNQKFMDYGEIIELLGGRKQEIDRQIDAYHDMNDRYRNLVDDTAFKIDRFSGFLELQHPRVKQAIFDAGLDLDNFGEWIKEGKIFRLADVRRLPDVLNDDNAKKIFLEEGINSIGNAIKYLDSRKLTSKNIKLKEASILQLADALNKKLGGITLAELKAVKSNENDARSWAYTLTNLSENLADFIQNVSE